MDDELLRTLSDDMHRRIYGTVDVFDEKIYERAENLRRALEVLLEPNCEAYGVVAALISSDTRTRTISITASPKEWSRGLFSAATRCAERRRG
jgi:hypothetical protein